MLFTIGGPSKTISSPIPTQKRGLACTPSYDDLQRILSRYQICLVGIRDCKEEGLFIEVRGRIDNVGEANREIRLTFQG